MCTYWRMSSCLYYLNRYMNFSQKTIRTQNELTSWSFCFSNNFLSLLWHSPNRFFVDTKNINLLQLAMETWYGLVHAAIDTIRIVPSVARRSMRLATMGWIFVKDLPLKLSNCYAREKEYHIAIANSSSFVLAFRGYEQSIRRMPKELYQKWVLYLQQLSSSSLSTQSGWPSHCLSLDMQVPSLHLNSSSLHSEI